ncbi:CCA tRNA nucleotidyltransferase [Pelagibacterales bacterium SAG-MED07]|nr:CCA tRNA nucleotidyltransferase [Pelagibacterales bacterium SAG-MED07]
MRSFLDKIFFRSNNLDYISQNIKDLTQKTPAKKIFEAINSYSSESEIRYVGGCIRKIINKENVDDIDLATNLLPGQVCEALKKNNISYYETGFDHGTITALEDKYKFEITTLREDVSTDGRHAKVKFSKDWKDDSLRRDFTINSIYSDRDGNLFDPHNGKKDLENGIVSFIGDADKRIKEDYLRILRYLRFFLNYSKQPHDLETIKTLKVNIDGISKLSKERLLDELRKIMKLDTLEKLTKDKLSLDLISMIFPELKNFNIFSKLSTSKKNILKDNDFIFLLSLMIIDETDNTDYFLYKFKISKKNQKRIKYIDNFYKEKINSKTFFKNNMNKFFYYHGKQAILDILNYRKITSKKEDNSLNELIELYVNKELPKMPISADLLIKKYEVSEGRQLGEKLKEIEDEWIKNNFKISDQQVDNIINN